MSREMPTPVSGKPRKSAAEEVVESIDLEEWNREAELNAAVEQGRREFLKPFTFEQAKKDVEIFAEMDPFIGTKLAVPFPIKEDPRKHFASDTRSLQPGDEVTFSNGIKVQVASAYGYGYDIEARQQFYYLAVDLPAEGKKTRRVGMICKQEFAVPHRPNPHPMIISEINGASFIENIGKGADGTKVSASVGYYRGKDGKIEISRTLLSDNSPIPGSDLKLYESSAIGQDGRAYEIDQHFYYGDTQTLAFKVERNFGNNGEVVDKVNINGRFDRYKDVLKIAVGRNDFFPRGGEYILVNGKTSFGPINVKFRGDGYEEIEAQLAK